MEAISKGIDNGFENLAEHEKIEHIEFHFKRIMQVLGLNLDDASLKDTPKRVAKMYVKEIFDGLSEDAFPKMTLFENDYQYDQMLIEKDITLYSYCAHHFVPIIGKAHVAYYPSSYVVGLSKINRLVQHFAKRPQVQEKLTMEIANALIESLRTEDIAVLIEADHLCVASRGIKDTNSTTQTSFYSGKFRQDRYKQEFLNSIQS